MIIFGICLYLIGVVIAWVLSIGSLASQCPSLTDPYESVREFPILWESCFDRQYNSTKSMRNDDYRLSCIFALFSWCAVGGIIQAVNLRPHNWKTIFKAMHLFPRRFPSKEEVLSKEKVLKHYDAIKENM
jgi:hypothetical protein